MFFRRFSNVSILRSTLYFVKLKRSKITRSVTRFLFFNAFSSETNPNLRHFKKVDFCSKRKKAAWGEYWRNHTDHYTTNEVARVRNNANFFSYCLLNLLIKM